MDLSPIGMGTGGKKGKGNGKGDKSGKPKECECRKFSAALKKKAVQPDRRWRGGGPRDGQEGLLAERGPHGRRG